MPFTPLKEDEEMLQLQRKIRGTPVTVDLVDKTMQRYEVLQQSERQGHVKKSKRGVRKVLMAVSAAAAALVLMLGSAAVSPVLAASLEQVPGLHTLFNLARDLGLRTAGERGILTAANAGDTHNGITLTVPAVMYDGTRVSVGLEREGEQGSFSDTLQEQMGDIQVLIDGKELSAFSPSGTSNSIGLYTYRLDDSDMTIVQFSDLRNQGGQAFPDRFTLTLQVALDEVDEPYAISVPVEKYTDDNMTLSPAVSRTYGDLTLTVNQIELTPVTVNISTNTRVAGNIAQQPGLHFDVTDDKGEPLQLVAGNGWNATGGSERITDTLFEPLLPVPSSITIQPYYYLYDKKDPSRFELDAAGRPLKTYIPELEMTIPIPR